MGWPCPTCKQAVDVQERAERRIARLRAELEQAVALLGPMRHDDLPELWRACGDATCVACGLPLREHPHDLRFLAPDGAGGWYPYVHRLCDGKLVKL